MTNAIGADGLYLGLISFEFETKLDVLFPSLTTGETKSLLAGRGEGTVLKFVDLIIEDP